MQKFNVGDRVQVSNGKPMPPKHHTKKLRDWHWDNYVGEVVEAERDGPDRYTVLNLERSNGFIKFQFSGIPASRLTLQEGSE